jgi:hypothetical protein
MNMLKFVIYNFKVLHRHACYNLLTVLCVKVQDFWDDTKQIWKILRGLLEDGGSKILSNVGNTSHKSNPSSICRGIIDLYCTQVHVGGGNSCGGYTLMGVGYDTRWLAGLWSTQAKAEGIVLRAAWHWGRDSSVVNDPLREADCTPLYVGLRVCVGLCGRWPYVFPHMQEGSFLGTPADIHEWMNRPVAPVTEYPCPWGPVRERGGSSLTRDSEGKIKRYVLTEM